MEMGSFVQRAFDRSEGSGMKDISRICGPRDWEWWIVWFITFRGKESIRIFARRSSHRFIQHHRHGLAFFFFFGFCSWVENVRLGRSAASGSGPTKSSKDVDWLGLHQESWTVGIPF